MSFNLKSVFAGTLLLVFAGSAVGAASKPNIIVILADDIGWSDTSAMGGEIRTPNLEKLADNGRTFTQFYNTARCCPSRASLLTGLYPHQTGVGHMLWNTGYPGYATHLTSETATIPEVLHGAGYRNYMVGKWHLSERVPNPKDPKGWPLQRGFDKFYGTLFGYGSYYDPAGLCRDMTYITPENDPEYKPQNYYYTDAISDNAIRYLDDHKAAHDDQPFFMYVAYTAAHWPLHVPEDSLAEYKGKYDGGYDAVRQGRLNRLKEMGRLNHVKTSVPPDFDWNLVKDKSWEAERMEAFAAIITRMDTGIGRIMDHLKEQGKLDNTVIMYLQDNGGCDEEFFQSKDKIPANPHKMAPDELQDRTLLPMQTRDGKVVKGGEGIPTGPAGSYNGYGPAWAHISDTPFRKVKKYTYEGGISTPLIVQWPAAIARQTVNTIETPGHLIDLLPTITDIAGAAQPVELNGVKLLPVEGRSLLPALKSSEDKALTDRAIFWEHEGNRAVRKGKWKLVADEFKPWELYNLDTDRGESENVAADHPDAVKELAAEWDAYAKRAKVEPLGAWRLREPISEPKDTSSSLVLSAGDFYERPYVPALGDKGVSITVQITEAAADGVLVSQGGSAHGYALYMKEGKLHFTVNRDKQKFEIVSAPLTEKSAAVVNARLDRSGEMELNVSGQPVVKGNAYGPLLLTPDQPLTVGFEWDSPVGDYEGMFSFQGLMAKNGISLEVK